ncbi:hypothetical protein N39L_36640 [Limnospira platensis NIES-39]|nr:hypothetical protein N39L_17360 [Arthrospira platensis NIES-39]BDT13941.1 hypothetical protein N39L_36640 [Arthrospira platensis NIES-39]
MRLHFSLLPCELHYSLVYGQSIRGVTTFRLYGHSIVRFVLSTVVLLKVCVGRMQNPPLFPLPFWAQRVNLFRCSCFTMVQVGHSVFLIIDGWQWSRLGSRFYLTPSVPRFYPGVMISKTGGGYRRYSLLPDFSVRL